MEYSDHQDIIPGLPDDVALDCLVRLPFRHQSVVKSVCHDWRRLLFSDHHLRHRRKLLGLSDHLLFLIQPLPMMEIDHIDDDEEEDHNINEKARMEQQHPHGPPGFGLTVYNITSDNWSRIQLKDQSSSSSPVSIPMFCQCVAVAGKLLLIGGWDPVTLEPVPDVYIIDLMGGGWRKGARMNTARSFFACAAAAVGDGDGAVYVAGGHDRLKNALRSAEVYDVAADEWRSIPDMIEERDECHGIIWDNDSISGENSGGFWVVSGYGTDDQGQFRSDGERFDPETRTWEKFENLWPFPGVSPRVSAAADGGQRDGQRGWCVVVDGESGEMKGFDWEDWKWKTVRRMGGGSGTWVSISCGGDRVFAMGGDGGAVVVEKDGNGVWGKERAVGVGFGFAGSPFSGVGVLI